MINVFKKSVLVFAKVSLILVLLTGLGVGALFYKVSNTPLILDEYKPYIREKLSEMLGGIDVDFDHAVFRWKKINKPFYISVQNLKVTDPNFSAISATIPKVHVKLNPIHLLRGKLMPSSLEVFEPKVTVNMGERLAQATSANEEIKIEALEPLLSFLNNPKSLLLIKNISITDAQTHIEGLPQALSFLKESRTNFSVLKDHNLSKIIFELESKGTKIHLDAVYDAKKTLWQIVLKHEALPLVYKSTETNAQKKADLYSLHTSGTIEFNWQAFKGLQNGHISINGRNGLIDAPSFFDKNHSIENLNLEATYEDGKAHLNNLSFKVDESSVIVKGEGLGTEKTKGIDFALNAEARDVILKDLKYLWPKGMAEVPRDWVTRNIKMGKVPYVDLNLKGRLVDLFHDVKMHLDQLEGKIDIANVSVDYLKGMPSATGVFGQALYDQKNFRIQVNKGECHGQKIVKGNVLITKMDEVDQDISIDLNIEGSVKSALELIDFDPLHYAREMKLKSDTAHGYVKTHLKLDFPLETTVTLKEVKVDIKSNLERVRLEAPIQILPVQISAGDFLIVVDQNRLLFKGDALLNQSKAHITWQRNFLASETLKNKLEVTSDFDAKLWAFLGLEKIGTVEGISPLHLVYDDFSNTANLQLKMNTNNMYMRIFGTSKEKGSPGHVEIEARFKQDQLAEIKKFDCVAGDAISIQGSAEFTPGQVLPNKINVNSFKLGKTKIKPKFKLKKNKTYRLTIEGGVLDLESILDQLQNETDAQDLKESFDADVKLDELYVLGERPLKKVEFNTSMVGGMVRKLNMRGYFATTQIPRALFVVVNSPKNGERVLEVTTNHFGELMQSLGLSDRLLRGRLVIKASHDNKPKSPWIGRFKIYDFNLKDPPVLGKLLSLAFPTDFMDLLSDKGMPFSSFSTRFKYKPESIVITDGRAKGSSLGLTVSGSILTKTKELKLHGSVIPAYFLNTLIAKIPLLGEVITGGKDEGLFGVTYTITGFYEKPDINVNPLSAFAPGLIRKIFSSDEVEADSAGDLDEKDDEESY